MPFSDYFSSQQRSKSPPPESTNQEAGYLKALAETKKSVFIKLVDGEVVTGWILRPEYAAADARGLAESVYL